MRIAIAIVLCAAACKKADAPPTTASASATGTAAATGTATASGSATGTGTASGSGSASAAELSDDCRKLINGLIGAIDRDARAMDPPRKTGEVWAAIPVECRGGYFFYASAVALHSVGVKLESPDLTIASANDAITAGLALGHDVPELLAYDAYLSALDPSLAPALPGDACDAVTASPLPKDPGGRADHDALVAYVCGHAQLLAGTFADAAASFGAIEDPPYPDVLLRKVQALVGSKDLKGAKKLVRWAKEQFTKYGARTGVGDGDGKLLQAQLDAAVP